MSGGLVMCAVAVATLSRVVRGYLGGLEELVLTLAGLVTAAAVVTVTLLSRTIGLPGGYHPTGWGWPTVLTLVLAVTVLLVHVLRLALASGDAESRER
ncbi:hypothetical protein [Jannaschia sp. R86511]|uniref:hypothetical protein n=1 Tax=Jannaschia sp. R86511 TaxID=3093853 RepID=UPI0036D314DB